MSWIYRKYRLTNASHRAGDGMAKSSFSADEVPSPFALGCPLSRLLTEVVNEQASLRFLQLAHLVSDSEVTHFRRWMRQATHAVGGRIALAKGHYSLLIMSVFSPDLEPLRNCEL